MPNIPTDLGAYRLNSYQKLLAGESWFNHWLCLRLGAPIYPIFLVVAGLTSPGLLVKFNISSNGICLLLSICDILRQFTYLAIKVSSYQFLALPFSLTLIQGRG
jgi:hypothetical protein